LKQGQIDLTDVKHYIAEVGITASALRNQGKKGLVEKARKFLSTIDMDPLRNIDPAGYPEWLDGETEKLERAFQTKKKLFGPARKCVNIFMVMASLNRFLCVEYNLNRLENMLEVPLDNKNAQRLLEWAKGKGLPDFEIPKWKRIKTLDGQNSKKFQDLAAHRANELGVPRGRLDIILFRNDPERR